MPSVPFYDFPSSPLLIIGALGIVVALAVFFLAYQKKRNCQRSLRNDKTNMYKFKKSN